MILAGFFHTQARRYWESLYPEFLEGIGFNKPMIRRTLIWQRREELLENHAKNTPQLSE